MSLLEVEDLVAGYGGADVIRGLSLHVDEGEVAAVLGPNGAGKTTLLRAISGDVRPSSGAVRLDGQEIGGLAAHQVARLGVGHVLEGRHIFTTLSVEENLLIGGRGRRQTDVAETLEQMYGFFPILRERRALSGASLSGGQQQMLAVARGLMSQPRILLLDEPSLGMSPRIVETLIEQLMSIVAEMRLTILLVEQTVWMARMLAGRAYVIEHGTVALESDMATLTTETLASVYLGGATTA
jgi:branched-chain amino acid transport system ATP-binding protein